MYTRVIIWVNTILGHINTRTILPRYKGSCIVYRPKDIENKNIIIYPYPTGIKKCEILIVDTQIESKKGNTRPRQFFSVDFKGGY
jgi:hypothetical protein